VIVAVSWMKRARHVGAVRTVDMAGGAAGGGGVQETRRDYASGLRGLVGQDALRSVNVAAGSAGGIGGGGRRLRGGMQAQREGGCTGGHAA
jgi:hypothetical protein